MSGDFPPPDFKERTANFLLNIVGDHPWLSGGAVAVTIIAPVIFAPDYTPQFTQAAEQLAQRVATAQILPVCETINITPLIPWMGSPDKICATRKSADNEIVTISSSYGNQTCKFYMGHYKLLKGECVPN